MSRDDDLRVAKDAAIISSGFDDPLTDKELPASLTSHTSLNTPVNDELASSIVQDASVLKDNESLLFVTKPNVTASKSKITIRSLKKLLWITSWRVKTFFNQTYYAVTKLRKNRPRKLIMIVALLLTPVAVSLLVSAVFKTNSGTTNNKDVLSATVVKGPNRTLYYPTQLPRGYHVADDPTLSFKNGQISTYTITNGSVNITVNTQDDIPEQAFNRLFKDAEKVDTPLGQGYIKVESRDSRLAGVRLSSNRALLVNASRPLDKSVLSLIILSLKESK